VNGDAIRAFLTGLIDYAGLFPPARLDLDTALDNYAGYRLGDDSWMLGRFIIPASRLEELAPHGETMAAADSPYRFSVLVGGGPTSAESLSKSYEEAGYIDSFCRRHGEAVHVQVIESCLSADVACSEDGKFVCEYLNVLCGTLADTARGGDLFLEIPTSPDRNASLGAVLDGVVSIEQHGVAGGPAAAFARLGLKLRCGGLEAASFPSVKQVARYLIAARERGVPMKCTAGLHHPLRHLDASMDAWAHGFLNLFGAGLLTHASGLNERRLVECLEDEDATNFRFDNAGFHWRDQRVGTGDIERLRQDAVVSFGSCSFDEPREDLRELGMLD